MTIRNRLPEPELVWEIARLFPPQGEWSEQEYLELDTNHPIEFTDGHLEFLPMPTTSHQRIVAFLFGALHSFVSAAGLGEVLFAGLRVKTAPRTYREPDIVFMLAAHLGRAQEESWDGADLVMEVVSDGSDDRNRDLVKKRRDYALAGISEYWIVDPRLKRIIVLALHDEGYREHGCYRPAETAESALLKGFKVDVDSVFAAARGAV